MSPHLKPTPHPRSLRGAWHAQVAATAKHAPWLVRELLRRKQELLPKFTAHYQQLRALPRRTRQLLQRQFAPSLAGAALLLALGQGQAIAATINVVGGCSLIDAITAANTNTATGGCTAGSGADTINLPTNSTHTLTSVNNSTYGPTGLPVISTNITIDGNGSTITRSSVSAFRIFAIGSGGNLTLQETTVSGGVTDGSGGGAYDGFGGGVYNRGTLTLTDSTITGNRANRGGGGVSNYHSTATLSHSTITGTSAIYGGGGGVDNDFYSTVTLSHSTITGNSAYGGGGGVSNFLDSTVTLSDSTITGNSATYGDGGGVHNHYGTVALSHSTITGNRASDGGGVFNYAYGTVTLSHSTITGNRANRGSGVFNGFYLAYSTVVLSRTLIAGNTAAGSGAEVYSYDTITADNFNLFGHNGQTDAQAFYSFTPGATDLTATSDGSDPTTLTDILDTTLADNGGPTLTHALVSGSPAIDASPVDADCPTTDQRGVARPQGVACDIGAFELGSDGDGDGIVDSLDNCPNDPNAD